jgi:small subunit ribosomal protein S4
MLSQIRGIARTLLGATEEQRQALEQQYLKRMARMGILPENATIDNILDLSVKDLMERRLQTMVLRAGLAKSVYQARQFVSHGHITVAGNIVSVPGYIVKRDEESRIAFQSHSALSNAQHPARAAPTGRRVSRIIEEAETPARAEPVLPEVKVPEIREEVQAEQPLELPEVEEEEAPAEEEAPGTTPSSSSPEKK